MSDHARRDPLRDQRRKAEGNRRLRTRRPIRGHVPSPAFVFEGEATVGRIAYAPVVIDPSGDGDYPEAKRIVGLLAKVQAGACTVQWSYNDAVFEASHLINDGESNTVMLAEPLVLEAVGWIEALILTVSGAPNTLACAYMTETVPV
jgi:hypothetical protein